MESANFTDLLMIDLNHSILEVINSKMPCLYFIFLYISMNYVYIYIIYTVYIYIQYIYIYSVYIYIHMSDRGAFTIIQSFFIINTSPIWSSQSHLRLFAPFNFGQRGTALIGLDVQSSVRHFGNKQTLWPLWQFVAVDDVKIC